MNVLTTKRDLSKLVWHVENLLVAFIDYLYDTQGLRLSRYAAMEVVLLSTFDGDRCFTRWLEENAGDKELFEGKMNCARNLPEIATHVGALLLLWCEYQKRECCVDA